VKPSASDKCQRRRRLVASQKFPRGECQRQK